ncbi:MAG TPA: transglutaminase-like domain-containing protein [Gemmataceae bacterium]
MVHASPQRQQGQPLLALRAGMDHELRTLSYNTIMNLDMALMLLSHTPDAPLDLAETALALARDEYPALDVEAYLGELDGMAHEARPRLRGDLTQRVRGLCRYLFHDMGFRGNQQNYYDPRNSYLNDVLDRRAGIPITLSAVAMAVGRRAGLHVVGVGLPGHFVAKAVEGDEEVLFDPFHGGRLLTPEKCRCLVERVTDLPFEVDREALRPVPLGAMVLRMLNNLKGVYLRTGDYARAARVIERLRQLSPNDPLQQRDLGATLFQAGQVGRAIDHLQAYLQASPKAGDADMVEKLLTQARASVARWN